MINAKHPGPPPEGMIGPRVTHLSKLLRCAFNEALAEQGLFSGQQEIVFYLIENRGITASELSKRLGVSPASVSVSVKRMEKAGFITKSCDDSDARIVRLYPTEKACAAPENIKKYMDSFESILSAGMSGDEVMQLCSLLQKAIGNMEARGEQNG